MFSKVVKKNLIRVFVVLVKEEYNDWDDKRLIDRQKDIGINKKMLVNY